ncbi:MAG: 4-oxalocrotonate tautomerase family protein [Phycisphaerales bacterium JB037]
MPLAQIKVVEGVFDEEQKRRIIRGVTDAIAAVEAEPLREKTYVLLEEVPSGCWGIGGEAVTTQAVRGMFGQEAV